MPCLTYEPEDHDNSAKIDHKQLLAEKEKELAFFKASLCMVCTTLERLCCKKLEHLSSDYFDFKQAGISSNQFFTFWIEHRQKDEERLRKEAQEALIKQALSKLSPAEKEALGLKG